MRSVLPVFLAVLLLTTAAVAGDDEAKPLAIGDVAPAFELKDLSGGTFTLADARTIDEAQVLPAVLEAAKALAGDAEVTVDTELASIAGLQGEDGSLDAAKARAMLQAAGTPHGLIVSEASVEDFETVQDVVDWLTDSAEAPIVFMCWSPMCPTSRRYESRLVEIVAATGARIYPLASASNKKERDEDAVTYVADNKLPYRVLLDRQQVAADIFGGKVTPHIFVLDGENRLAYAGGVDSDPRFKTESADERQNWLADALEALVNDRPLDVMLTRAKG